MNNEEIGHTIGEDSAKNQMNKREAQESSESSGSMTPGQLSEGQIERMQHRDESAPLDTVGEASDESFPASDPPAW